MKALEAENEILKRALDVESRFPRLALQLLAGKWKRSQSPKAMYFSGILQIIRPQNDNLCAFDDTLITFS